MDRLHASTDGERASGGDTSYAAQSLDVQALLKRVDVMRLTSIATDRIEEIWNFA
jgi:hypothetical protein